MTQVLTLSLAWRGMLSALGMLACIRCVSGGATLGIAAGDSPGQVLVNLENSECVAGFQLKFMLDPLDEDLQKISPHIMAADGGNAKKSGLQQIAAAGSLMLAFSLDGSCIKKGEGLLTILQLQVPNDYAGGLVCIDSETSKIVDKAGVALIPTTFEQPCALLTFEQETDTEPITDSSAELQIKIVPTQKGKLDVFTRFVSDVNDVAPVVTGLQFRINATSNKDASTDSDVGSPVTLKPILFEGGVLSASSMNTPPDIKITHLGAILLLSGNPEGIIPNPTVVSGDTQDGYSYLLTVLIDSPEQVLAFSCFNAVEIAATGDFSSDPGTDATSQLDCEASTQLSPLVSDGWQCTDPEQLEVIDAVCGDCIPFCGTPHEDIIQGTEGCDCIFALGGNDIVYGYGDNDIIYGNAGKDTIYGGTGADTLFGGNQVDMLYGGPSKDALYGGKGNDKLFGNLGDDNLWGEAGKDTLSGGFGNDVLRGNTGADKLFAGGKNGKDILNGGVGIDMLYKCGSSQVTILFPGNDLVFEGGGSFC